MVLIDWGGDKEWVHILGEGDASYAGFVCPDCKIFSGSSAFGGAVLGKRSGEAIEWSNHEGRSFIVHLATSAEDGEGNPIEAIQPSILFDIEIPEE